MFNVVGLEAHYQTVFPPYIYVCIIWRCSNRSLITIILPIDIDSICTDLSPYGSQAGLCTHEVQQRSSRCVTCLSSMFPCVSKSLRWRDWKEQLVIERLEIDSLLWRSFIVKAIVLFLILLNCIVWFFFPVISA